MAHMHFTIRVADFEKWKALMLGDRQAQLNAEMVLLSIWRCREDKNRAFFIMEAHDEKKALAFLAPSRAAEAKKTAGVLEFEWSFVEKEEIA